MPELNAFLASAIFALVLSLVLAAPNLAGIVNMNLARGSLILAWSAIVLGACSSMNNAPLKHLALAAVVVGTLAALPLVALERWIARQVQKQQQSVPGTAKGIAGDGHTDHQEFIVTRLREFLEEANEVSILPGAAFNWTEGLERMGRYEQFEKQVKNFLGLHLGKADVERFREKKALALEEIIKEVLDGQRPKISEEPHPVFECNSDTRFIPYGISWTTKQLFRDPPPLDSLRELPDDTTLAWAALARFYFHPDKSIGVDPVLYLSAHIEIWDAGNQKLLKRVVDGIWEGKVLKRSKHIQQGRGLELIVALIPMGDAEDVKVIYTAEGVEGDIAAEPDLTPISGTEFLVKVGLIPKTTAKRPFPTQPFEFKLRVPEIELLRTDLA